MQTIESLVFESVKSGKTQGVFVRMNLKSKGFEYSIEQIRGAMSRLKKADRIEYKNCVWKVCA